MPQNITKFTNSNNDFYSVLFANNKVIAPSFEIPRNSPDWDTDLRTLIFINESINEENKIQIQKIMAACRLVPGQYKVFSPQPWSCLGTSENIREVILFGIPEKELGLNIRLPKNQPLRFYNKIWIKTDDLNAVMSNSSLKNEFWKKALKPCFGL